MATTKTLTPTNQAITLAAFTEKPDNRTNVTNDDKLADAVNALNSNLEIPQMIIKMTVTATITSISDFNSVLSKAGQYYIETNASIRQTFIGLGLLPADLAGNYTVRKIANNYFFLEYTSYSRRRWFTTIDNGTLNPWLEVVTK